MTMPRPGLPIDIPIRIPNTAPKRPIDGRTKDKGLREMTVSAAMLSTS